MGNDFLDGAFDSNMSGNKKNLRVYLINPLIESPWRTHQDYIVEQKRETIRFWITIFTLFISTTSICITLYNLNISLKKGKL
jgi:hypothetical protein